LYFVISSGNKNEGSIQNQKNIQPELVKKDTLATNSENKQLAENKQSTKDNTKRETIKPKVTDKTSKVQAESIAEELRYVPINKGEVGKYKLMKYRFMNLTIGEQNVKSGNFENAIFIYKQLLNTFPDDESIYYKLAECYGKTGNLKMKSDAILKAQNILTKKTEDSVKTTIH
jgi:tetratricopeptide (TPR) repeat protein